MKVTDLSPEQLFHLQLYKLQDAAHSTDRKTDAEKIGIFRIFEICTLKEVSPERLRVSSGGLLGKKFDSALF